MTTLTFYDGVSEIGGNKIQLAEKEASVFLDFAMKIASPEEGKGYEV